MSLLKNSTSSLFVRKSNIFPFLELKVTWTDYHGNILLLGNTSFFFFESRIQAEASLPYSPAKFQNHSHTKPEALWYLLIRLEDDLESEAAHENP